MKHLFCPLIFLFNFMAFPMAYANHFQNRDGDVVRIFLGGDSQDFWSDNYSERRFERLDHGLEAKCKKIVEDEISKIKNIQIKEVNDFKNKLQDTHKIESLEMRLNTKIEGQARTFIQEINNLPQELLKDEEIRKLFTQYVHKLFEEKREELEKQILERYNLK